MSIQKFIQKPAKSKYVFAILIATALTPQMSWGKITDKATNIASSAGGKLSDAKSRIKDQTAKIYHYGKFKANEKRKNTGKKRIENYTNQLENKNLNEKKRKKLERKLDAETEKIKRREAQTLKLEKNIQKRFEQKYSPELAKKRYDEKMAQLRPSAPSANYNPPSYEDSVKMKNMKDQDLDLDIAKKGSGRVPPEASNNPVKDTPADNLIELD